MASKTNSGSTGTSSGSTSPNDQIYDKCSKQIMQMSDSVIIRLINAIFNVNHPLDSKVVRKNTTYITTDGSKIIADEYIDIIEDNGTIYNHLEFQFKNDPIMGERVYDYSQNHARNTFVKSDSRPRPRLPRSTTIRFSSKGPHSKDTDRYEFEDWDGTIHSFTFPILYLFDRSYEELKDCMLPFLPFEMLRIHSQHRTESIEDYANRVKEEVSRIQDDISNGSEAWNMDPMDIATINSVIGSLYEHMFVTKFRKAGYNMSDKWLGIPVPEAAEKLRRTEIELADTKREIRAKDRVIKAKDKVIEDQGNEIKAKTIEIANLKNILLGLGYVF